MDFAVYLMLVPLGVSIYWANVAGFCLGSVVNVILIRKFVFPHSRFRLSTDLQLSVASNGLMFGLGMVALWALVELAQIDPYGAKLLTNGATFVLNYVIRALFF
jgi:putative flippase GtrA